MLFFEERGKPEYPEKTSWCRVENQQTQPTYDARSHHCAIPAPLQRENRNNQKKKTEKTNLHAIPCLEIKRGPHLCEASALTTVQSLLPYSTPFINLNTYILMRSTRRATLICTPKRTGLFPEIAAHFKS